VTKKTLVDKENTITSLQKAVNKLQQNYYIQQRDW